MATLIESICRWNLIFHRVLGEDCIAFVWLTEEPIFTTASQRLAFLLRSLQSRLPSQSYRRAPVPLKFCKASRQRQILNETKSCHSAVCVDVTNHSWTNCTCFIFMAISLKISAGLVTIWYYRKACIGEYGLAGLLQAGYGLSTICMAVGHKCTNISLTTF